MTATITVLPTREAREARLDTDQADAHGELDQLDLHVPATTRAAAREAHGRIAQPTFTFDGGAGTWFAVSLTAFFVTVLTLGICYPWALVMTYRWKSAHTFIDGQRLRFTGTAPGLFGRWIVWLLLTVVTLGIYSFWVYPRLTRWIVEHQGLDSER